ncbi:PQQ-dependent sugar dehydrogenase [Shewanella sp. AS16]|uniref:PQQ-dependent sugar dehydrogenase n=1 Tax=Shewanella sp. AS16 TaxID=2907625 RepID=UPI001F205CA2|nr:PQQ-dependent sugar dehydrogenase [Shewanella sp. AS16]MCE9686582.1 PQQ-dependent sugar dehydrogenase [Shewanella sp. AS16]
MLLIPGLAQATTDDITDKISLPPGFSIEIYIDKIPNARQMALGDAGSLFVGSRREGRVYGVKDLDADGRPDKVFVLASELQMPSGIAFHDGALYVAAVDKILRYPRIEAYLSAKLARPDLPPPQPQLVFDDLPSETHHGWKYLKFAPDGELYIPIGAPCNICDAGKDYAKIIGLNLTTKATRLIAAGVRNSVGFDWHPRSRELWFTDNGRDMLGDDIPSDELNRVEREGSHFGYPYIHQGDLPDPKFGRGKRPQDYQAPEVKLGAHVAALGMTFYRGQQFPAPYNQGIFIAEHGSWNRSTKVGYKVSFVALEGNRVVGLSDFASGWLQGDTVLGRPADVLQLQDGSLLVADDAKGRVYRISYRTPSAAPGTATEPN